MEEENKYSDEQSISRVEKNRELYRQMNTEDFENYNLDSNVSVLNVKGDEIDIEKLRKILDKKYREDPKANVIDIQESEENGTILQEATKEYDLGSVMEKAKAEKIVNYDEERLKKVRDTQFDILKDIVVEENIDDDEVEKTTPEDELMTLIQTITSKESSSSAPLDILSDLKGTEETSVIPPITEEIANSFYTGNLVVKDEDYEEFEDLTKEFKSGSIVVKILLVIAFIIVMFAIVFFLDKTLGWGIF